MGNARAATLLTGLILGALCCAVYIVARVRRLSAQRADAAVRAAAALAELRLATTELRARQEDEPAEDARVSPGERLRRRYPGIAAGPGSA
ncbi:MAG TPA: hypothetical protein VJO52_05675 [Gemmatimonadaceae bacterium]|nr:hypothetical protein [Gemmatimonadaceae bacterium]